ncbi:MAG: hypothetical protein AAF968_17655 [Pseudomonadota bacterium]
MSESFSATLEYNLINRHRFANRAEAQVAVFLFTKGFYSPSRRHSSTGHLSPVEFVAAQQSDRPATGTPSPENCP